MALAAPAAEIGYTMGGESFTARLMAVDATWSPQFTGEPMQEGLVYWGGLVENQEDPFVLLANGSALNASILELTPESVTIGADPQAFRDSLWQRSVLPRAIVQGAVFRSLPEVSERDELWDRVQQHTGDNDVLWLSNGDRLEGLLVASQLTGRNPSWRIRTATGDVQVPPDRLLAVALRSVGARRDEHGLAGVLGFQDGSRVVVDQIARRENRHIMVVDESCELSLTDGRFAEWICYFRPPQAGVQYLSDLEPIGYRHLPYLSAEWPYYEDRSVLGTRLRTSSALYEKGLGVHSTCRLAYDIPAGAQRFQTELALDALAEEQGSVIYRVYSQAAGGEFELIYESDIVRGGEQPRAVDVAVRGAQRIALIVEYADRGDEMDRANWLMARFVE